MSEMKDKPVEDSKESEFSGLDSLDNDTLKHQFKEIELEKIFAQIFENEFEEFPHLRNLEEKANEFADKERKNKKRLNSYPDILNWIFRDRMKTYHKKRKAVGRGYSYKPLNREDAEALLEDSVYLDVEIDDTSFNVIDDIEAVYEHMKESNKAIEEHSRDDEEKDEIILLLKNDYEPEDLDKYDEELVKDVKKAMESKQDIEKLHEFNTPVFYSDLNLEDHNDLIDEEVGSSKMVLYQFRGYKGPEKEENIIFDIRGMVPNSSIINPRRSVGINADWERTEDLRY